MRIQHLVRAAVLLLAAPIGAVAQTEGVHVFIDGGPLLNHDMTWGHGVVTTAGGTLGGGIHLGPHSEIRLMVDLISYPTAENGGTIVRGVVSARWMF